MNTLPQLPTRFRQGEVLTADKLNKLLDWMDAVARALPGLEVRTASGSGLTYSHSSTGTVISLARSFAKGAGTPAAAEYVHPFKVSASWVSGEEGKVIRIAVAPGLVQGFYYPPQAFNEASIPIEYERTHNVAGIDKMTVLIETPYRTVPAGTGEPPYGCVPKWYETRIAVAPVDSIETTSHWHIYIAEIRWDDNGAISVYQYWSSDVTLPTWYVEKSDEPHGDESAV